MFDFNFGILGTIWILLDNLDFFSKLSHIFKYSWGFSYLGRFLNKSNLYSYLAICPRIFCTVVDFILLHPGRYSATAKFFPVWALRSKTAHGAYFLYIEMCRILWSNYYYNWRCWKYQVWHPVFVTPLCPVNTFWRKQFWYVLLVNGMDEVFTLSFFQLMHLPLHKSSKSEGLFYCFSSVNKKDLL